MKNIKILSILFLSLLILGSCQDFEAELDPVYTTNPTPEATADATTALNSFQFWYNNANHYYGPYMMLATMSDMKTCSWGNVGMRDMSSEPRIAWDNDPGYSSVLANENFYSSMYTLLANQSRVITAMEAGLLVPEDPAKTECLARFGQAAAIGYIALVYDRVWIVDETGVLFDGEPGTPSQAIEIALEKLDIAIQLAKNNNFSISEISGMNLNSSQFAEFLNSFAARLMVNSPRNSVQRDALDWNKVLAYTNNGLSYDMKVFNDGGNDWYALGVRYILAWARVDMRVVHLMDPNTTDYWTDSNGELPPATSDDNRLSSDFQYENSQAFIPSRGLYHFSNYSHSRYNHLVPWPPTGDHTEMLKAENDLYKAEAIVRSGGSLVSAASVINGSTRVTRGGLSPVAANETDILAAIHYERSVEILSTGMGLEFFEMRRGDLLQAGTPLHLPVPGAFLLAGGYDNYTFGGTSGVGGEDYSTGGWR